MPYILNDFPIETINELAIKESNAKKPIYQLHKWFARRVGCTFRALILSSFLEENPIDYYYSNVNLKTEDGKAPIILDPFMGGGTTIIEGHRLGCKMIGVDINPLAWFITKKELEAIQKKDVEEEWNKIKNNVENEILSYYKTSCENGHEADTIYTFWVRKIICENCNREVPLFRSFQILKDKNLGKYCFCPKCNSISNLRLDESSICKSCGEDLTSGYTTDKEYLCPNCNYTGDITQAWLKPDKPPEMEIFALEYYCKKCGRGYKKPDDEYIKNLEKAEIKYEKIKDKLIGKLIPNYEIPWDTMEIKRPRTTVFKKFSQFFNERQKYCLYLILNEILKIQDKIIREFFVITFSDSLNANNMFCIYNEQRRELEPLFGGHHISPPKMPVENNVWGVKFGRGSFSKYYKKSLRAIEYMKNPYEIRYTTKIGKNGIIKREAKKIYIQNEKIDGKFVDSIEDLIETDGNILLKCETSEELSFIPNNIVDAVITDPPYYDNIMYSEVSDFFYAWLSLILKDEYEEKFGSPFSRNDREILVNKKIGKDEAYFIRTLERVFKECNRVLKKDGTLSFVFQHKKTDAWSAVLKALLSAGFKVEAVYPTHGETRSGVRAFGLNYNSLIICKKRLSESKNEMPWIIFESELRSKVDIEIRKIIVNHPNLSIEDAYIIAMGEALEVYSQNYGKIIKDGEIFDITDINMEIMGNIVFDSLLIQILEKVPDVDRISKIYSMVFVTKDKVTNDTINKLTRHGGLETNIFEEEQLVTKGLNMKTNKITNPEDRNEFIKLKIKNGIPITYIDAAHLLWVIRENLDDFVNTLEMIRRYGLNIEKLEHYIKFLSNRTNDLIWKKIENTFSTSLNTLDDYIN